ncbi:MAG: MBL fold metallo-hydrolase [Treponema sp.]|nr:MBL fold metallo-hydrolase [Treponema sp.]
MKLFFQYCSYGFSNCYILGTEKSGKDQQNAAIIIDPGSTENVTLEIIEDNNFDLKAILVTHDHKNHARGLRTLKRIYNAEVIAVNQSIMGHRTTMIKDGDRIVTGGFTIEIISIPGHSSDSVVYKINNLLFTGDVLTAGLTGSTASAYGAATQMSKLRSRLLSLPGDYVVLPGHGPPSTLEAERRFNADIFDFDHTRAKRPVFKVDL